MSLLSKSLKIAASAALLLILLPPIVTEAQPGAPASLDVLTDAQENVRSELRRLASREGFRLTSDNTFFTTRAGRALAFGHSADGRLGVFLVASSENGEQDRLQPGVYTVRPVSDDRYVVLRNGERFSTTLTIKEPDSRLIGGGPVNDLCGGTSGSLHDLCTRLVVCHYADLWCPW